MAGVNWKEGALGKGELWGGEPTEEAKDPAGGWAQEPVWALGAALQAICGL